MTAKVTPAGLRWLKQLDDDWNKYRKGRAASDNTPALVRLQRARMVRYEPGEWISAKGKSAWRDGQWFITPEGREALYNHEKETARVDQPRD